MVSIILSKSANFIYLIWSKRESPNFDFSADSQLYQIYTISDNSMKAMWTLSIIANAIAAAIAIALIRSIGNGDPRIFTLECKEQCRRFCKMAALQQQQQQ